MVNKKIMSTFFNTRPNPPNVVNVGGKFSFKSLPKKVQNDIKDKLASKDPIVGNLAKRKALGVKIDGREVDQNWADQLDLDKPHIKRDDGVVSEKVKETPVKKTVKKLVKKSVAKKAPKKKKSRR